jgi:hypothetical protein
MSKVIKLTESDIQRISKRVLNEESAEEKEWKEVWIIINRESHGEEAIKGVYKTLENAMKDEVFGRYEETPEILTFHNGKSYAMSGSFYIMPFKPK